MKSVIRLCAVIIVVLSTAACTKTLYPIGGGQPLHADPDLTGTWRWAQADSNKKRGYAHFLPQKDGSFVLISISGTDWAPMKVISTTVGANRFLNERFFELNSKPKSSPPDDADLGYIPSLYHFAPDGHLVSCSIDETATRAAIRDGKIAGRFPAKDSLGGYTMITADQSALDAFMSSKEGLALFKDCQDLYRDD